MFTAVMYARRKRPVDRFHSCRRINIISPRCGSWPSQHSQLSTSMRAIEAADWLTFECVLSKPPVRLVPVAIEVSSPLSRLVHARAPLINEPDHAQWDVAFDRLNALTPATTYDNTVIKNLDDTLTRRGSLHVARASSKPRQLNRNSRLANRETLD